jgi:RNA polymerase sigma factor (sigma-70 family)
MQVRPLYATWRVARLYYEDRGKRGAVETARKQQLDDLCRRFRPALLAFFLRRVPNAAEAEDLAHDVFLRLAGVPLEQLRSADAYVFQVAANLLRDRARRWKVRNDYAAAEVAAAEAEEPETHALDPERIETARRSLAALVARLMELPKRTREIFILYRIENVARRDIAQAYGLSLSTVEKEVARATAHLMLHQEYPR